ncbi:hypothetical protein GCM10023219_17200 [Stakelama sediminis]|uniref:DUF4230 domain-containing protein n=1 Tax=Stakelama sediminis TaxID=463200 RepID=A0A840Z3I6_9SPHN|nr:DUF4230 domain-containing protein [Stakelama sediminis]MBB5720369.1 hypothetical protein [Stakelama sediminis]
MAQSVSRSTLNTIITVLATLLVLAVAYIGYGRYAERKLPTREEDGSAVTKLITARLSGSSELEVAELSGIIQSSAQDVRGFGMLKSDQIIKAPYSVGYFVDVSKIGPQDVEWVKDRHLLIVNAPDVTVGKPNIDEGARTMVRTEGLLVTRGASENLSQRTSASAEASAAREAQSPERIAQAREYARKAIARFLSVPLNRTGQGDTRIVVTFPSERASADGERWDVTKPIDEVLANRS